MKVIIAGSRAIVSTKEIRIAIAESGFKITEVVCGMARGVDRLGWRWAEHNKIPVKAMPAKWFDDMGGYYNRAAGRERNRQMAEYADALIAVWDGDSTGTAHMIETMRKMGKEVFVYRVAEPGEEE